jgi:hypothetical protein
MGFQKTPGTSFARGACGCAVYCGCLGRRKHIASFHASATKRVTAATGCNITSGWLVPSAEHFTSTALAETAHWSENRSGTVQWITARGVLTVLRVLLGM